MSLTSQLRVTFVIVALPLMQMACVSVPEVETRLKGLQWQPHVYKARAGDTLSTIAFRYELDEEELRAMNPGLSDRLAAGQPVTVHNPSNDQFASETFTAAPIEDQSKVVIQESAVSAGPRQTTITSAVTQPTQVYDAPEGRVSFDDIREIPANAIDPLSSPQAVRQPLEEVVPDELEAELGYESLPVATEEQINTATTQTIVAAPRGNATSGWVWPTWGEIAREFAPNETGGQGIDIAGIPGQEIHAASGGTVAYAGRDVSGGNGKLIIIRHHSGLMTTYSHAQQLFVAEDDVVRAGDVIASLGANARNESVLRFEVRQDGNPLNPMSFLTN